MKFEQKKIERIRGLLIENKQTIAAAESVTSGFLQAALGSATMASGFFQGGLTAYNIDQKVRHLEIDRHMGESCNCVSEEIAMQMASGITTLFHSDWGLAVTGYSTPVEESGFMVFAYYAIVKGTEVLEVQKIDLTDVEGEDAQEFYVNRILDALLKVLDKKYG